MFDIFDANGFEIIFFLAFFVIFGAAIFSLIKNVGTWNKNNHSPRVTAPAKVVSKREEVSGSYSSSQNMSGSYSHYTDYYVTFQFTSGDRSEFEVKGTEYGMLVEGDEGNLTFQGTRFLNFDRTN